MFLGAIAKLWSLWLPLSAAVRAPPPGHIQCSLIESQRGYPCLPLGLNLGTQKQLQLLNSLPWKDFPGDL